MITNVGSVLRKRTIFNAIAPRYTAFGPQRKKAIVVTNLCTVTNPETAWKRAPPPLLNPEKDALVFQHIEVDETVEHKRNQSVFRLYGVTEGGNSVVCRVKDFYPYFYFPAPVGFQSSHLPALQQTLSSLLGHKDAVRNVEIVMKRSGHRSECSCEDKLPFIKVTVDSPNEIAKCTMKIDAGFKIPGFDRICQADTTFEGNLDSLLRFVIDKKVSGCNWIQLPAGSYKYVDDKTAKVQIEVETHFNKFVSLPPAGEWAKMAPLRVLSFDIECIVREKVFPQAQVDPVIQIASVVQVQGQTSPFINNIFTLNTCAPIEGAHVLSFADERDLLSKWSKFFEEVDPDVVVGYNTSKFDIPYLIDRAKFLGIPQFANLGRIRGIDSVPKPCLFESNSYASRNNNNINIEGRLQLDIFKAVSRDYRMKSFKLDSVSKYFLKEKKEDVPFTMITGLQNGTPETRRRLAVYCLKDALLPLKLMDHLKILTSYVEKARKRGIPFNFILEREEDVKAIPEIYHKASEKDVIFLSVEPDSSDDDYGYGCCGR
ncbi:ribonuclease H-like domain-containing protein [Pilobolus umbonatus]|nr:ribonuclease H-like domain-containing protein [Pilobolus umbonatus]